MIDLIPWTELFKVGGMNAALAYVVWKLWNENKALEKELKDTHKQQAEFWRHVAFQVEVKE